MPSFAESAMPADCMALQSTRPSAMKFMTKFGFHTYVTKPPTLAIFQTGIFKWSLIKNDSVLVDILLKYVLRGPTEN